MKLQALVSTMNQNDKLIEKMHINTNAVIINQCNIDQNKEISIYDLKIKWIDSIKRGLSLSRNMALKNAESEICHFADDDLVFIPGYEELILNQFKKYPNADIIAFQVEGIERKFKDYHPSPREISFLTSMKISSVEIAFRLDKVKKSDIIFNELFGAGSKYIMGEENIFLIECLKRGLKIMYVPVKIADLHMGESTWFKGFTKEYFVSKGAQFTAMSKRYSLLLIAQFAIRKAKLFNKEVTLFQAIRYMLEGKQQFLFENKKTL